MRALITGATGLIGRGLATKLTDAVVVSRDPDRAARALGSVETHRWEPETGPPPTEALREVDAVFNLAGEAVADGRWTVEKKRRIRDSRIVGTRNLVAGFEALQRRPRVLVSASAVGYYGDRGDELLEEDAAQGEGFLADVCAAWEHEALAARELGMRVVCVRVGVVLARNGGALAKMLTPFKTGAGGRLASGRQWMPWIHHEDVIGILLHASENEQMQGAVNAVSPRPVTNADFTRALGRALHRPTLLPMPKAVLRIALGELSEILLASQRVLPRVAERNGYTFEHPRLQAALEALVS